MKTTAVLLLTVVILAGGCGKPQDPRINLRTGVGSDTLSNNIVTRPVVNAFSVLAGDGIEVNEAVLRKSDAGFTELYITGYNNSVSTKRFQYRVDWLDADGLLVETKASTWQPMSATGRATFSFKVTATSPNAVDFRMDTRKWE